MVWCVYACVIMAYSVVGPGPLRGLRGQKNSTRSHGGLCPYFHRGTNSDSVSSLVRAMHLECFSHALCILEIYLVLV